MGVKFYAARDWSGKVTSVYKAEWDDRTLTGEQVWNRTSKTWEPTGAVSYWFFNGNNLMEELSAKEAATLLPATAL